MFAWTWQTHPERARRYARRFEEPKWRRLDRRRLTRASEADEWISALASVIDEPPEIES